MSPVCQVGRTVSYVTMSAKRKKRAREMMREQGITYMAALRQIDRFNAMTRKETKMPQESEPLGEVGYQAYATATGGKTFDGRDMPKWSELPQRIRDAWTAAAEAITVAWDPK